MSFILNREPIKETLIPAPDGVRVEFQTSRNYKPKSVSVWLNGMRLAPSLETGFLESGGSTITMKEAPWAGDSLQVQYDPDPE